MKDGTPGEIANLSLNDLPQNIITQMLYNLSSNDLTIALSKIYSSNPSILSNLSSSNLVHILSKLSSEDLAIVLKYNRYYEGKMTLDSISNRMDSADLTKILNQYSTKELLRFLETFKGQKNAFGSDLYGILLKIPTEKIKYIISSLYPNNIHVSVAQDFLEGSSIHRFSLGESKNCRKCSFYS